jgi:hypothetical protein
MSFKRNNILSYRNFNKLKFRQPFLQSSIGIGQERAGQDRQKIPIRPSPFEKEGCPKEDSARGESRVPIWFLIVFIIICLRYDFCFPNDLKPKNRRLFYEVYFNGILVGNIEWEYLGRKRFEEKEIDVIQISSDTEIIKIFSLSSKERISLDSSTHLPIKVEREVIFFGKKEFIEETYNQDDGFIKITRRNLTHREDYLYQNKPIHNISALFYFFPKDIDLKREDTLYFNLPTQKIEIKKMTDRTLSTKKGLKETYFLSGRGIRKFNLWLDKEDRLPLRLEFFLLIGKISILRKE